MENKTEESLNEHVCFLCGEPCSYFVRDACDLRKVPLCEGCFNRIQPTRKNKQRIGWWQLIFPIVEEV